MSKLFGSKTLARVFRGQRSDGESSSSAADGASRTDSPMTQQPDLYSTEGPIGMKVVADSAGAIVDIVFVHGLTGNREKTWTHANGNFWPAELAKDFPMARIMTFGYDADVLKLWGMAGSNNLRNHGKSLAFAVSDLRRECRNRPVIFIAHSLGGLVCEQALLICSEGERNLETVFRSTLGIIFMGTPHGGADLANWGFVLAKYLNVVRKTNTSILGSLRQKSEVLTAVQQQFQQMLRKPGVEIDIFCFFEEKAVVGVGTIVPEQSAVLSQYPNQSIAANHMDMTKFSSKNDEGYQKVLNRAKDFLDLIKSPRVADVGVEQDPQLPDHNRAITPGPHETGFTSSQMINNTGPGQAIEVGRVDGGFHIHQANTGEARSEKEKECHRLLRTSDYERHKDRNPYPVKGTCKWFLNHVNYTTWRDTPHSSLLWVSADPGCGKSVLSKLLADKELQKAKQRTVCYFFFKDDSDEQKTSTNALCALLHQLFCHKPNLLEHAVSIHDTNGANFIHNIDLLWKALQSAFEDQEAGEIVCILDALDECRHSELAPLLRKICVFYKAQTRASERSSLKFLVTSRPLQRITDEFSDLTRQLPTIRLAGEEDTEQIKAEINLVIEHELENIRQKWNPSPKAMVLLREELDKVEHRTYLWLKLIFELIHRDAQSMTKQGRRAIFGRIPDSVDAAYTKILNQSKDKEQAKRLLQIVCVAVRPLTVTEMGIALTIQEDDKSLDDLELQTDEYNKIMIRNLCGLFVSVIDGRVYLLHQTAKEFLIGKKEVVQPVPASEWIWKYSLSVRDAHYCLAHICMWYLRLKGFQLREVPEGGEDEEYEYRDMIDDLVTRYHFHFLDYAARNWGFHFREAEIPEHHPSIDLALSICSPQEYPFTIWGPVYWWYTWEVRVAAKLTSLHLASHFGHRGVVARLIQMSSSCADNVEVDVNAQDEDGWTPLRYAVGEGHAQIVSKLIALPGIDINMADVSGDTPLSKAAFYGHVDVVKQLLAIPGIDINIADGYGNTPLSEAVYHGHVDIVMQLLAVPGIDINKMNKRGETPLSRVEEWGHVDIIELLLQHGAKETEPDSESDTDPEGQHHRELSSDSDSA